MGGVGRTGERSRGSIGTIRIKRRFFFLSTSLLIQSTLETVNASVISTELRDLANTHLLFWNSYDCALDAATQLFGPMDRHLGSGRTSPENLVEDAIDLLLRGGAAEAPSQVNLEIPPCANATLLDHSIIEKEREHAVHDKENLIFSLFQDGDGSEEDPDGIPLRYLRMQHKKRDLAAKALEATLIWRREHKIDTILKTPHPKFDLCKAVFPHYFLGRDRDKHVVFLQRPAMLDQKKAKANGLTNEDMLMHYVYVNEYLWQIVEADEPLGTMTSIIDLQGLDLGILRQHEIIGFLKKFVTIMDSHYPQRANKTLILNAPKWFNMLYKILSPLLRESTKAKIEIYTRGKKQDEVLKSNLGDAINYLPSSFWSKNKRKLRNEEEVIVDEEKYDPDSEMEKELRRFVLARLEEAGVEMLPVYE